MRDSNRSHKFGTSISSLPTYRYEYLRVYSLCVSACVCLHYSLFYCIAPRCQVVLACCTLLHVQCVEFCCIVYVLQHLALILLQPYQLRPYYIEECIVECCNIFPHYFSLLSTTAWESQGNDLGTGLPRKSGKGLMVGPAYKFWERAQGRACPESLDKPLGKLRKKESGKHWEIWEYLRKKVLPPRVDFQSSTGGAASMFQFINWVINNY